MQEGQSGSPLLRGVLGTLSLGPARLCQNLTMFPLFQPHPIENPSYQLLDAALAAGTARITEISTAGSVPELQFENSGGVPVLLLDGEELIGAKQNRVLNLTVLAPPLQTIRIPVSCVEAGRWSQQSAQFAAAPRAFYAAGRATKAEAVSASLRTAGTRRSDQGEVWADLAAKAERLSAHSPTDAMSALFEGRAGSLDEFVAALPPTEGQVGALFAIGKRPVGIDLFDHPATFEALLPKLVRSYALDALDAQELLDRVQVDPLPADPEAVQRAAERFMRDLGGAHGERYPAVGLGEDCRFHTEWLSGGALLWSGRMVHLSAFPIRREAPAPASGHHPETRVARPSRRARHH